MVPMPRAALCLSPSLSPPLPAIPRPAEERLGEQSEQRLGGLLCILLHLCTEKMTLESEAWRWVSFVILSFVEPQPYFWAPLGVVQPHPQATAPRLALPRPARHTAQAPASWCPLWFSAPALFLSPGSPLPSCRLSRAVKSTFVTCSPPSPAASWSSEVCGWRAAGSARETGGRVLCVFLIPWRWSRLPEAWVPESDCRFPLHPPFRRGPCCLERESPRTFRTPPGLDPASCGDAGGCLMSSPPAGHPALSHPPAHRFLSPFPEPAVPTPRPGGCPPSPPPGACLAVCSGFALPPGPGPAHSSALWVQFLRGRPVRARTPGQSLRSVCV